MDPLDVTIKPLESALSVEPVRAQKLDGSGKKILPYSRRDYYKIWMTKAKGKVHYAAHTIELKGPALIFSSPMVPYAYEPLHPADGYFCIFTEGFLHMHGAQNVLHESPLFKIGSNPVFPLTTDQTVLIAELFEKILVEYESRYLYRTDVIRNYLHLIIHEAMKMTPEANVVLNKDASERIANLFLELLSRQFPVDPKNSLKLKKASDFAANLSVHVNHLNYAVRKVTGKSTSAQIVQRIVTEANGLLKHTDWTIADIAYALGFDYPNYFNNFFKKHTGHTPNALRRAIL